MNGRSVCLNLSKLHWVVEIREGGPNPLAKKSGSEEKKTLWSRRVVN